MNMAESGTNQLPFLWWKCFKQSISFWYCRGIESLTFFPCEVRVGENPGNETLLFRMFKNTCQSPDLPLLCYLLVFTDLLSADLLCKLLKRVPGLLGGHITPRSILGRYYTPFPLLPSHPHPPPPTSVLVLDQRRLQYLFRKCMIF